MTPAATESREDAVQRSRLLGRAPVVRDRIAFGNTGHPDEKPTGEVPGARLPAPQSEEDD